MKDLYKRIALIMVICLPLAVKAQVGCDITLPYTTGFESDVSNQAPACWTTLSGEAYTFDFFLYAHSGDKILAFTSSSGEAKIATPLIPLPLNQVGVSLWYVDLTMSTTALMRVGFTTSLSGTIQWIDTIANYFDYTFTELDFSHLSITDTGYLVFAYSNISSTGVGLIDDMTIFRNSNCSPVTNLRLGNVTNSEATVTWTDSNSLAIGYWCYIADTNSRVAAFDSIYQPTGLGSVSFDSLTGGTTYYVWVVSDCGGDYGRDASIHFTTNNDCGSVRNLQSISGYRSFGLSWDEPAAGEAVTAYRVAYKPSADTHWTTGYTTNRYYHVSGLAPSTHYDYSVTTLCTDSIGITAYGDCHTLGCTANVIAPDTTHLSLPLSYTSAYSYTQQIYLASELSGIDTITSVTFFLDNRYNMDTTPILLYLGNVERSMFSSGSDYVPYSQLSQVFAGNIYSTGQEVTVYFDTPFAREVDSNLVLVMKNDLNYFSSVFPRFAVGNAAHRSIYRTSLSEIDPLSPSIGQRANYVNSVRFGVTGCTLPACDVPTVCVTEVGDDHIALAWSADSIAPYTVAYRALGDLSWTVADDSVTTGSYLLDSLSMGQIYRVRVSHACGTDTLVGEVEVSLPCNPVSLPLVEDFESYGHFVPFERSCWRTGSQMDSTLWAYTPSTVSTNGYSGQWACRLNYGYIVFPRADQPLNELQLKFSVSWGSADDTLLIGLLQNLYDTITSVTIIDTFSCPDNETALSPRYTEYISMFNQLNITDGHLVIMDHNPGHRGIYIDNLRLEAIPNCAPTEHCTISNITTGSATVSWPNSRGHQQAVAYIVEYGPWQFTPGTGTRTTVYDTSAVLYGLNSGSDYDLYVQAICNGDTSSYYGPVHFSTLCAPISTLPYSVDFEGLNYIDLSLPTCWYGDASVDLTFDTNYTSSGSGFLRLFGQHIVALPLFSDNLNNLKVQMHVNLIDQDHSMLIIGTVDSVTPGFEASFTPIDTLTFSRNHPTLATFYLTEYTGTGGRLAIKASPYPNATFAIDDVTVDHNTDCVPPAHISMLHRTATTATLTWRTSQAPTYTVEYGPQGFTPGTGLTVNTNSRSVTLTGLLPSTTYHVYVTAQCNAQQNATTRHSFTTLHGNPVSSIPYFCDFSDSVENSEWELLNGDMANQWHIGSSVHTPSGDNMSLYISNTNGTTHNYDNRQMAHVYAYRVFNLDASTYHIHYNWLLIGERNWDYLRVFMVPINNELTPGMNPYGTNTTSTMRTGSPEGWIALDGDKQLYTIQNRPTLIWQTYDSVFTITNPGQYYLLFYWLNDNSLGNQPPAVVDNISISHDGCTPVENVEVTGVTSTSISLQWSGSSTAQSYIIEFGTAGFAPGTGNTVSVTDTSYTITGLVPETGYDIYIKTLCAYNWYADSTIGLSNIVTHEESYYTITLLSNNDLYGTVHGGGTYMEGATATLTANAALDYRFVTWDDGNRNNPRQMTVVADTTLMAIFEPITQDITVPDQAMALQLYPNPASRTVTVVCPGPATVVVNDITGRQVLRTVSTTNTFTLDISSLAPGAYFVRMENEPLCPVRKLMVR